jgi:hypothetical protein
MGLMQRKCGLQREKEKLRLTESLGHGGVEIYIWSFGEVKPFKDGGLLLSPKSECKQMLVILRLY